MRRIVVAVVYAVVFTYVLGKAIDAMIVLWVVAAHQLTSTGGL